MISEARKGARADAGVRRFIAEVEPSSLFLPVQVIGELGCGAFRLARRGDLDQARLLEQWIADVLAAFEGRILAFDHDCAVIWGRLMADNPHNPVDKQIAAVALIYDLTLVTRDVADMAGAGVKLMNPFAPAVSG